MSEGPSSRPAHSAPLPGVDAPDTPLVQRQAGRAGDVIPLSPVDYDPYAPESQPGLAGGDGWFRIHPDGGVERLSEAEGYELTQAKYARRKP